MEIAMYFLILIIAAFISLSISFFSVRRRPANAALPLAILMFCVAEWVFAQTFQDLCSTTSMKLFWYNVKFLGIVSVPVVWLVLSLRYSRYDKFLSPGYIIVLSVIPFLTTFAVWTNSIFKLFLTKIEFESRNSLPITTVTEGIWFWVHTYYSYLLILLGVAVIFSCLFRLPSIYRKQTLILLSGVLIPLFGNILTVFRLVRIPYSDITPFALLFTGILFFWALFRYKLLDLVPIARHAVFENMRDIILVVDNQKRIVDVNPAAVSAIGGKASDIIGKPIANVLSNWSKMVEEFGDTLEISEKLIFNNPGNKKYYDLRISPVYDRKGRITGRLAVLSDITRLEEAMLELEASRKAAEDANKAKSRFLATMSHEIRTPMNAIIGMSELLASSSLTQEQKEYLEMIQLSADSLLSIINDILDFSKIEAGKLVLEEIDFNMKTLVDELSKALSVQAQKKDLSLMHHYGEDIPDILVGDPVRVRQILTNLIGNSIKFTSEGKVEVSVELVNRVNDFVNLRFSVTDTGIGISEDKIQSLFQVFHQLDSSTTRKFGGTGLGLSIVKSLVELMGGSIEVKSRVGEGSNFSFTMTFRVSGQPASEVHQEAAAVSAPETKQVKILLAEDNKVNQMLMIKLIEKKAWSVDVADNGRIALSKLDGGNPYDIILMDIQMPEMDGFEAASAIREKEKATGAHIPIIALTANAMKGDRDSCLEAGMDDYLSKPIKPADLYEMVKRHVN